MSQAVLDHLRLAQLLCPLLPPLQSQKTQGFCVADFATLSDERRSRWKIFLLFIWIKDPCVRQYEGLARSKLLQISQTDFLEQKCQNSPQFKASVKYV